VNGLALSERIKVVNDDNLRLKYQEVAGVKSCKKSQRYPATKWQLNDNPNKYWWPTGKHADVETALKTC